MTLPRSPRQLLLRTLTILSKTQPLPGALRPKTAAITGMWRGSAMQTTGAFFEFASCLPRPAATNIPLLTAKANLRRQLREALEPSTRVDVERSASTESIRGTSYGKEL